MRLILVTLMLIVPMLAAAQSRPPQIKRTNPPTLAKPTGYTHVVEASGGRTVYISGQIALDQTGKVVGEGDMKAQASRCSGIFRRRWPQPAPRSKTSSR